MKIKNSFTQYHHCSIFPSCYCKGTSLLFLYSSLRMWIWIKIMKQEESLSSTNLVFPLSCGFCISTSRYILIFLFASLAHRYPLSIPHSPTLLSTLRINMLDKCTWIWISECRHQFTRGTILWVRTYSRHLQVKHLCLASIRPPLGLFVSRFELIRTLLWKICTCVLINICTIFLLRICVGEGVTVS